MIRRENRKGFISVKKYRSLAPKCKNCDMGKVTGGVKRDEAKRISKCFYCDGSGIKKPNPVPIEIFNAL